MESRVQHWDAAYAGGDERLSWFKATPRDLARRVAAISEPGDAVIDVGGGSSPLAGELLALGYRDLAVLDLSPAALELARGRLGEAGGAIEWIVADITEWRPARAFDVWHDRAVLHFLTADADRDAYAAALGAALKPGGHAVIGVFAEDGPARCSGLPVRRQSHDDLAALLGEDFAIVSREREIHTTPSGNAQPFNWVVARRRGGAAAGH